MASQCYPKAREKFLTAQLSWTAGTLRCILLPDSYVPNFDNEFLSDIFAGVRIATSAPLSGRTATNGFASSNPIEFALLTDPRLVSKAVIYKDTGVETTADLIFLFDSPELVTAPFALVGFDYFVYPNAIEGGFFRL